MTAAVGKRSLVLAVCAALVVGFLVPTHAEAQKKKKKKKKPQLVQVDQEMFLRGDGCDAEARRLSLEDGDDLDNCIYTRSGLLYEVVPGEAPAPVGAEPWQGWPAAEGVPFMLDATKPLTGEIYTKGFFPLSDHAMPWLSLGVVRLHVEVLGETGGEEVVVGEFVDEYLSTPSASNEARKWEVEIELEEDLDKKEFTSLTLRTSIRGVSVGHGRYVLTNPWSSFITIPTWARG